MLGVCGHRSRALQLFIFQHSVEHNRVKKRYQDEVWMLPRQSGAMEYRDAPITRGCSYHSVLVARGGRNCPRTHLDVFGYFKRVVHRRGSIQILPLGLMQVPGENLVVGIGTCPFCTTHAKRSLSVRLKLQRTPRPNIITRAESPPVLKECELTHSYAPVWSLDEWLRSTP
jgi:hypothetical protein